MRDLDCYDACLSWEPMTSLIQLLTHLQDVRMGHAGAPCVVLQLEQLNLTMYARHGNQ